jgi:predicted phage terminase large subunit-like protein
VDRVKATRTLLGTAVDAALQPFEMDLEGGKAAVQANADRLSSSLLDFVVHAWKYVWPNEEYVHGWHVEAICTHLQAVSDGELRRLQIWVPPGSTKSTIVSIMWPAWEWTRKPQLRYITASYDLNLSTSFSVRTRDLIKSDWYRLHWPHVMLRPDWDLKRSYANTLGGTRLATSVGGDATVTGQHGHRLVIDDPLNAQEVLSDANLASAVEWHDGSMSTRFVDAKTSAEVIIMQRLSELDLAAHVLEIDPDAWTILCLPEAYEHTHPHKWPGDPRDPSKPPHTVTNPDGTQWDVPQGDGALLIPGRIGPREHAQRQLALGAHRAAGQLQQRPAPKEGAILKRSLWRYYPPAFIEMAERGDVSKLPQFTRIVISWDTAFKDKTTSDFVCGITIGVRGGHRYLLKLRKERMGFAACLTAMNEAYSWATERWTHAGVTTLVENRANGPEIIATLRKEIPGVIPYDPSIDKVLRAEACEPDFESGSVYVPGALDPGLASYDVSLTPSWVQDLIESCAVFPNGTHDDDVDSLTSNLNWSRVHASGRAFGKKPEGRVPSPNRLRLVS